MFTQTDYIFIGIAAVPLLIVLFYYLVIFLRLAIYNVEASTMPPNNQQGVSIIVAAQNEEEQLPRLIEALKKQNYPLFEIILIDDRSHDNTRIIIFNEQKADSRIRMVRIDEKPDEFSSKKYAITLGVKAAKYEWLLFTDADCLPNSENWLAQMAAYFVEKNTFVIGVSLYEQEDTFLNDCIQFETFMTAMQYLSWALWGSPYMAVGRNLAYRKSVFMDNNGFYKHIQVIGGDDDLLVNRLAVGEKTEICLQPTAQTTSIPKTTWAAWYQQKKRHLSVSKYYKWSDKFRLGLFNFALLWAWVATWGLLVWGIVQNNEWLWGGAAVAVLLRWVVVIAVSHGVQTQLQSRVKLWAYPMWEVLYLLYVFFIGWKGISAKYMQW
jgi:glycosyltransferase involved in cell wall biosynthesis